MSVGNERTTYLRGLEVAELKERLSQVIMDAMSSIDIDSMTQNEKLKLIQIGLTYVIPRLKQVESIEEEEPRKFEIEIIDSLSKYSDKELDKAIKDSVPSNIEVQQ